jgi:hypothetical protein
LQPAPPIGSYATAQTADSHGLVTETEDARKVPRGAAQEGARTLRLSAAGTTLRMETVAGTFDPLLTETLGHMFRLD